MKLLLIPAILILMFNTQRLTGQASGDSYQVSTTVQSENISPESSEEDDFEEEGSDPGLFIMLIFMLGFICICIGAGIVIAILILSAIFVFISIGIVSVSAMTGLYNRSFEKGFKIFVLLTSAAGGILVCATGLWLVNKKFNWLPAKAAIFTGAASGLLAGIILGLIAFYILRRLLTWFRQKSERQQN